MADNKNTNNTAMSRMESLLRQVDKVINKEKAIAKGKKVKNK